MSDLFGVAGQRLLDDCQLGEAYSVRVESLRDILEVVGREVAMLERRIATALANDAGYRAVQAIHGVGPVLAAVFVAEIGDVSRFAGPRQLCSWAGLTPRHRESDTTVHRGHITKQGSRLVRWAAVEAVARQKGDTPIRAAHHRIADRRGKAIGRVAAAASSLPSSTTACATARSAAWPRRGERSGAAGCEFAICHGPTHAGRALD